MAAKAPAKSATKVAKSTKKSKTASAKGKLTSAQYGAYAKASAAAIKKAQLQQSASALQQRRLQGAAKALQKLSVKRAQTIQARIGKNAVRATYQQTAYAKQSKPLRIQAAHRLFKAQGVATQKQFAYLGEALHARTSVLQTLTNSQAKTASQRYAAAARKSVKSAVPKGGVSRARTNRSRANKALGRQAGLAAAARVPASKTRTASGNGRIAVPYSEWIVAGNDLDQENCVAVAMANHLLYQTGRRVTDGQVHYLASYHGTTFAYAFGRLDRAEVWSPVGLSEYGMVAPENAAPGMMVGFEVVVNGVKRDHCAVLLPGNKVVSWGEVVPLESEIDEVWEATWLV